LTTLATRAIPTASSIELESALLTPDDLGVGGSRESSDTSGATVGESKLCDQVVSLPPIAAAAIYRNGDGRYIFMFQAFLEFPDEGSAKGFMDRARDAFVACDSYVATDGVRSTTWEKVEIVDMPVLSADEQLVTYAEAIFDGAGPSASFNSLTRYGPIIMSISPLQLRPASREEFEAILQAADSRFQRVITQ